MMRKLIWVIALLAITDLVGCVIYYNKVQNFLSKQPSLMDADLMVVFQRNIDWETRTLGTGTRRRLDHAIELYNQNNIDWILCVGGSRPQIQLYGAQLMKNYLVENNLAADKILYDSLSYDTETNWAEAIKVIEHYAFDKVVAVSSPLHVYRIAKIINRDNVFYSAYNYTFQSISDYWFVCYSIHYEWAAFIVSSIIPAKLYHRILVWLRQSLNLDWI